MKYSRPLDGFTSSTRNGMMGMPLATARSTSPYHLFEALSWVENTSATSSSAPDGRCSTTAFADGGEDVAARSAATAHHSTAAARTRSPTHSPS